ncbi:hypothetical protein MHTCC0001_30820 [Flavobacteriaceae bacterium MHTCC 0001]
MRLFLVTECNAELVEVRTQSNIHEFMIVLIAPEYDIINELEILHQLFQEGLQYYHLRKPNKDYKAHCDYLNQIDSKYHNNIVTHYFHELVNEFDLKGIHFQEAKRQDVLGEEGSNLKKEEFIYNYTENVAIDFSILKSKTISSSFHEPIELQNCTVDFDYHLLSPVFSSISKKGYKGRGFDVNHINKRIVGMGGVTANNLSEFTRLGFKGVGVLGGIWNSKSPISNFKLMRNYFTETKSYI